MKTLQHNDIAAVSGGNTAGAAAVTSLLTGLVGALTGAAIHQGTHYALHRTFASWPSTMEAASLGLASAAAGGITSLGMNYYYH